MLGMGNPGIESRRLDEDLQCRRQRCAGAPGGVPHSMCPVPPVSNAGLHRLVKHDSGTGLGADFAVSSAVCDWRE
jgi:hypothetical protein